jgi:hypothetical protein
VRRAAARRQSSERGATPYYFRGQSHPQTVYELIGKAILAALADAQLTLDDVDGFTFFAAGFDPGTIIEQLGIRRLTFSHIVSGYGGGMAGILDLASMGIETGRAKTILCIGAAQQVGRRYGQSLANFGVTPDNVFHRIAGLSGPGQALALSARRHMHLYGTRREAFGEIVWPRAPQPPHARRRYGASRSRWMNTWHRPCWRIPSVPPGFLSRDRRRAGIRGHFGRTRRRPAAASGVHRRRCPSGNTRLGTGLFLAEPVG